MVCLSILVLITGCNQSAVESSEITFGKLFADPEQYNGKEITIEGFCFHGFEVTVLAERLEYSGYAPGHLVPKGRMMWIEGGIPEEIYNKLDEQRMILLEKYGKVRMTGRFEYGSQYGHAGGYSSQIVPTEVVLLPWSPPAE
jgi:hypothetical protein